MADALIFILIGFLPPFLLLRRKSSLGRVTMGCALGVALPVSSAIVAVAMLEGEMHVPVQQAGPVVGEGMLGAILGPTVAVWSARKARAKAQRTQELL